MRHRVSRQESVTAHESPRTRPAESHPRMLPLIAQEAHSRRPPGFDWNELLDMPQFLFLTLFGFLAVGAVSNAVLGIVKANNRSKERLTMLHYGVHPDDPNAVALYAEARRNA